MYFPDDMTFQSFFFTTYPGYFLQALPIALITGLIFILYRTRHSGDRSITKALVPALFICYITGLLCLTLFLDVMSDLYYFLFYRSASGMNIQWFTLNYNLALRISLSDAETIGNFLMFLPFGALYPLFRPKSTLVRTASAGVAVCLAIEFLQPIFGRSFDISDILLNGLAIAISASVFHASRHFLFHRP